MQDALGLHDVVEAGHAGHGGALLGEDGRLANDAKENLAEGANSQTDFLGKRPDTLLAALVAGSDPDGASKVPEIARRVIGDEEGLTVDPLVVKGHRLGGGGDEEHVGGEEVAVGSVASVGEVEKVVVVSELDSGLALVVGTQETGKGLDVALAEDGGGSDGGSEEGGEGLGAVGLEDEFLGGGLGLGVVLGLQLTTDDGPALVGVVEVAHVVADDTGGGSVDEGLDAGLLASLNDAAGALDVNLVEESLGRLAAVDDGGGRVDDDVRADLVEEGSQAGPIGDVALAVGGGRVAVTVAAQVDRGDGFGSPLAEGDVDDVVAQEAVTADNDDAAEVASLLGQGLVDGHCD